jgi:glycosyltransferase involved in cell wall biosynthesis
VKICFFTENFYKGGLDTFIINLANAWPVQQDELTLLCNDAHPGLATIAEKTTRPVTLKTYNRFFTRVSNYREVEHTCRRSETKRGGGGVVFGLLQYPIILPWYVLILTIFFRRYDYERLMVVNGGYPASLICRSAVIAWRLAGKKPRAVMNFHNSTSPPPWYYGVFENVIDNVLIRASACFVSVSENCANTLKTRKAFVTYDKLFYIHNGIEDPVPAFKADKRQRNKLSCDAPYCLMLATYEPRKGHSYLLQAFKVVLSNFNKAQLKIYGHGRSEEKRRVSDMVSRLGLEANVTLGDFDAHADFLLANSSILVVPSQAFESFGLTIIEAMAFGVPVVTTDVGGMPEVLGNSNSGFSCSKDNPKEFANAITSILTDPALAAELGRNGRLTFEQKFSSRLMAEKYNEILKREV